MVRSLLIGALLAAALMVPALAEGDGPILSTSTETEVSIEWNNTNVKGRSSLKRENAGRTKARRGTRSRTRTSSSRSGASRSGNTGGAGVDIEAPGPAGSRTIRAYDKALKAALADHEQTKEALATLQEKVAALEKNKADKPVPPTPPGEEDESEEETDNVQDAPAVPFWELWTRRVLFVFAILASIATVAGGISAARTPARTPRAGVPPPAAGTPDPRTQALKSFQWTAILTVALWVLWYFAQWMNF